MTTPTRTDREAEIFDTLQGEYRHFCEGWDYMAIDETMLEFEACGCQFRDMSRADEIKASMTETYE